MAPQIKCNSIVCPTTCSEQRQRNIKAPYYCSFVGRIHQLEFPRYARYAERLSMSWLHIVFHQLAPKGITQCTPILQWRRNERHGVSNHGRLDCLFNYLFRHTSKKTSKFRLTGLCEGHRWTPCTQGQWRGKCFHLMTSSFRYANLPLRYGFMNNYHFHRRDIQSWPFCIINSSRLESASEASTLVRKRLKLLEHWWSKFLGLFKWIPEKKEFFSLWG